VSAAWARTAIPTPTEFGGAAVDEQQADALVHEARALLEFAE